MPRRLITCSAAVAASLAFALPASASAADCGAVDQVASGNAMRSATLCLLNVERTSRGLKPLRQNAKLRVAAARHSRDMVKRRYFAHDSLSGAHFGDRIAKTGYLSTHGRWVVGENLAWGTGSLATPRAIVKAWMESAGHRANILNGRFREIGIGIVRGAPVSGGAGDGATYTTDFGAIS